MGLVAKKKVHTPLKTLKLNWKKKKNIVAESRLLICNACFKHFSKKKKKVLNIYPSNLSANEIRVITLQGI